MTRSPRLVELLRADEKPLLSFQLMSDLHLEFFDRLEGRPQFSFKVAAPILALLGDIGQAKRSTYEAFLALQSTRYEHVIILAGNHEYYNNDEDVDTILKAMRAVCAKFANVHFLQQDALVLGGVRFIGATLWSFVEAKRKAAVRNGLNDYRLIHVRDAQTQKLRSVTVDETNAWHQADLAFIEKEIAAGKAAGQQIVVFTHHTPSLENTSAPEHDGSPINCAFSTNLHHLFGPHVQVWAFGHTHFSSDQLIGGTRVVSNQLGYTYQGGPPQDYDPEKVIRIYAAPKRDEKH